MPTAPSLPRKASGSSLSDFGKLSKAEQLLLDQCALGKVAKISDRCPRGDSGDNRVNADFLRFLMLGGDESAPVHASGVHLRGAWIEHKLELWGATIEVPVSLQHCRIKSIDMTQADIEFLNLSGSRIDEKLFAKSLNCKGSFFLVDGFKAREGVLLDCARIGGDLFCCLGLFEGGILLKPLSCERAIISGSVYLSPGFRAKGPVCLSRAKIEGDLDCRGLRLEGTTLELQCAGAHVEGTFVFQEAEVQGAHIDLSSMRVGSLADDFASWAQAKEILLDDFIYRRFGGNAPVDAKSRIAWLSKQPPAHLATELRTQPWDQLIITLRDQGHVYESRAIAIARETRLRRAGRIAPALRPFHWLYGFALSYGYQPSRLVTGTMAIWLLCGFAYWAAVNPGWFGGTTHLLRPPEPEPSAACLVARAAARSGDPCPPSAPNYRTFSPLIYSANVMLPAVSLDETGGWQPVTEWRGRSLFWGRILNFIHGFETLFGWFLSLQLAGMLGNLIKRE